MPLDRGPSRRAYISTFTKVYTPIVIVIFYKIGRCVDLRVNTFAPVSDTGGGRLSATPRKVRGSSEPRHCLNERQQQTTLIRIERLLSVL